MSLPWLEKILSCRQSLSLQQFLARFPMQTPDLLQSVSDDARVLRVVSLTCLELIAHSDRGKCHPCQSTLPFRYSFALGRS